MYFFTLKWNFLKLPKLTAELRLAKIGFSTEFIKKFKSCRCRSKAGSENDGNKKHSKETMKPDPRHSRAMSYADPVKLVVLKSRIVFAGVVGNFRP